MQENEWTRQHFPQVSVGQHSTAAEAYLVSRGGGPEQEVLRELAAINGRSARQELRRKQEREHDHHARRHLLPAPGRYSIHCLCSLPASGPAYAILIKLRRCGDDKGVGGNDNRVRRGQELARPAAASPYNNLIWKDSTVGAQAPPGFEKKKAAEPVRLSF